MVSSGKKKWNEYLNEVQFNSESRNIVAAFFLYYIKTFKMKQAELIDAVTRLGGKVIHQSPAAVGFTHPAFQTDAIKQIADHNSLLCSHSDLDGTHTTTILVKP